jgi:general secretion pathway protein M
VALKLNKREKYYVSTAVGFVVFFALMQLVVFPLQEKRSRLKRTVDTNAERIQKMQALSMEYQLLRQQATADQLRLSKREPGFSLFSFLDGLVTKNGLKNNISYMKPSNTEGAEENIKISSVEMKLQDVSLEQLTQYLYDVENSMKNAMVKRISISEASKQEGSLEVVLQVETIEKVQP